VKVLSNKLKKWNKRFFTLNKDEHKLEIHTSEDGKLKRVIPIEMIKVAKTVDAASTKTVIYN
jgi:hypothetical protein